MATVVVTPKAVHEIADLPSPIVARMDKLVSRLRQWPNVSGVKRLKGDLAGKYRLRTGDYRLQFYVQQTRRVIKGKKVVKGKAITEDQERVEVKVVLDKAGHRDGFHDE